jgi:uncharacterized protein YndB with AHSA1/START domain
MTRIRRRIPAALAVALLTTTLAGPPSLGAQERRVAVDAAVDSIVRAEALDRGVPGASELVRIDAEVEIHAPPADVWAALITAEGLAGWVAPESHVELRIGGPYELYFRPDEADRGMEGTTVLAFIPEEMLATTGEAAETWSVWRLDSEGDGVTRVRLTGLGTSEEWRQRAAFFRDATPGVLEDLKRYLEGTVGG